MRRRRRRIVTVIVIVKIILAWPLRVLEPLPGDARAPRERRQVRDDPRALLAVGRVRRARAAGVHQHVLCFVSIAVFMFIVYMFIYLYVWFFV